MLQFCFTPRMMDGSDSDFDGSVHLVGRGSIVHESMSLREAIGLREQLDVAIFSLDHHLKRGGLRIPGEATSEDGYVRARFDAEPWFEDASDDELEVLAAEQFGGEAAATVAAWGTDRDARLRQLFEYVYLQRDVDATEVVKFVTCRIDRRTALEWLHSRRPAVWRCLPGAQGSSD